MHSPHRKLTNHCRCTRTAQEAHKRLPLAAPYPVARLISGLAACAPAEPAHLQGRCRRRASRGPGVHALASACLCMGSLRTCLGLPACAWVHCAHALACLSVHGFTAHMPWPACLCIGCCARNTRVCWPAVGHGMRCSAHGSSCENGGRGTMEKAARSPSEAVCSFGMHAVLLDLSLPYACAYMRCACVCKTSAEE